MSPTVAREDLEHRSLVQAEAFGDDGSWDADCLHSADRFDIDLIEAARGIPGTKQSGAVFSAIAEVLALGSPAKVAGVIVGPTAVVVCHQMVSGRLRTMEGYRHETMNVDPDLTGILR